jgi:protein NRD1
MWTFFSFESDANRYYQTRWGVGYGPRDCSDYQTGISIIPISRLTEADRKWMVNAEYGGSGGRPIAGGLVVEEPDIEIGQGVSSKAISRRMVTDQSGTKGPRSTRAEQGYGSTEKDRYGRREDGGFAGALEGPATGANMTNIAGFNFALPAFTNLGNPGAGAGAGAPDGGNGANPYYG